MFTDPLRHPPKLDPEFLPAAVWNRHYRQAARKEPKPREVVIRISRPDGKTWDYPTPLLPDSHHTQAANQRYGERLVKFLVWAWGGNRVSIQGAPELVAFLQKEYSDGGQRAFDAGFMGETCFLSPLTFESVDHLPEITFQPATPLNRDLTGCRIGFDLGGSDRKCAALIDGEVVHSEEVKWDPYFQSDPSYHLQGIRDSLQRAANKLPRVDAIGGSAAGIYLEGEPRVASLFRGVHQSDFDTHIRGIFKTLQKEWDNVPFVVANDGDVTALAGAMFLNDDAVLGVSMGTSEAAGYVDGKGNITGWLNELAFAPVDYHPDAPTDEWSGDRGCGVQYFSQQAVGRLIPKAGLDVNPESPLPERLEKVQEKMRAGDERAAAIYETIGAYLGYTLAHYADFYDFRHLLLLGRVSSGEGGQIIQETASELLAGEFPDLAPAVDLSMPDETMKRHGQAVAAASLPTLNLSSRP